MPQKPKKPAAPRKPRAKRTAPKKKPRDLRETINVHALIEALEQHVLGKKKMTTTQVSAALALLKKTLPDIALSAAPAKTRRGAESPLLHEDALRELE